MLANAAIQSDTLWHHSTRKAVDTICLESIVLPKEKEKGEEEEEIIVRKSIRQLQMVIHLIDEKISINLHRAFVVVVVVAAAAVVVVVAVVVAVVVVAVVVAAAAAAAVVVVVAAAAVVVVVAVVAITFFSPLPTLLPKHRISFPAEIYKTVADGNPSDEKISMNLHRAFVVAAVVVVCVAAAVVAINFFSPLPTLLQFPNTQSPSPNTH